MWYYACWSCRVFLTLLVEKWEIKRQNSRNLGLPSQISWRLRVCGHSAAVSTTEGPWIGDDCPVAGIAVNSELLWPAFRAFFIFLTLPFVYIRKSFSSKLWKREQLCLFVCLLTTFFDGVAHMPLCKRRNLDVQSHSWVLRSKVVRRGLSFGIGTRLNCICNSRLII